MIAVSVLLSATIIAEETSFSGDIPLLPENLLGFNMKNAFFTGGLNDNTFELSSQLKYLNLDGNLFKALINQGIFD